MVNIVIINNEWRENNEKSFKIINGICHAFGINRMYENPLSN